MNLTVPWRSLCYQLSPLYTLHMGFYRWPPVMKDEVFTHFEECPAVLGRKWQSGFVQACDGKSSEMTDARTSRWNHRWKYTPETYLSITSGAFKTQSLFISLIRHNFVKTTVSPNEDVWQDWESAGHINQFFWKFEQWFSPPLFTFFLAFSHPSVFKAPFKKSTCWSPLEHLKPKLYLFR